MSLRRYVRETQAIHRAPCAKQPWFQTWTRVCWWKRFWKMLFIPFSGKWHGFCSNTTVIVYFFLRHVQYIVFHDITMQKSKSIDVNQASLWIPCLIWRATKAFHEIIEGMRSFTRLFSSLLRATLNKMGGLLSTWSYKARIFSRTSSTFPMAFLMQLKMTDFISLALMLFFKILLPIASNKMAQGIRTG